jgi:threonine dehydrogenase-like Zn-dependent dehydrogenase
VKALATGPAPRCSATQSSTARFPAGQAEFLRAPQAQYGPSRCRGASRRSPRDLSDVLPTAWQAVEYANLPEGETVLVLGVGPIGEMATRVAIAAEDAPRRQAHG